MTDGGIESIFLDPQSTPSDIRCTVTLDSERLEQVDPEKRSLIFVGLYDKAGRLIALQSYPVAEIVEISLNAQKSGERVKVFWTVDSAPVCDFGLFFVS